MPCRYCPAGRQGTVLGIAVDLSALPYLLRLFPGSSPSGRPRSVGPRRLRLRQSEKSCKQRFGASPVGDAGWNRKRRWPGLPVREAGRSQKRAPFLLGQAFRSKRRESEACVVPPWPDLLLGEVGVKSERRSSLARPSGRRGGPESEASIVLRLDRPSSLSLGF